ncbi:MAG: phosphate ABC transporter permease subunit PstC [Clostridia bacterium]|nr:phosphate ABC transporter permease subunit PstC [Clostridia bacterium]
MPGKRLVLYGERAFGALTLGFALLVLVLIGGMVYYLIQGAAPALAEFGWRFLVSRRWDAVHEVFGALPFIYGTIASSLLALVLAVPLGVGAAVYLAELAPPWIRTPLSFMIELLAAVPSVVYGLWGLFVMAPWLRAVVEPWLERHLGFLPLFRGPAFGVGILAAGVVLAIMILPTISSVSREVMLAVPDSQREAMLALGATRWETTWKVVIPYGRSGIIGAVILGLGRALGETMAATMVIGNSLNMSLSLFHPANTMASIIVNEFAEAVTRLHTAALIEIAFILFLVTLILNVLARLLVWRVARGPRGLRRE